MEEKKQHQMAFGKENYIWLAISLGVLVIGYLLMAGGGTEDPTVFKHEEIFSFRRITLAPLVVLLGFILGFYAILKKAKD
tara:strand:+ start:1804 stop:2043 length:240 start_codon:yes stop_codon:yes gene_type:complete